MDKDLITQELDQWLQDFVEKPHVGLENWAPCPYARKARLDKQIKILFSGIPDLKHETWACLPSLTLQEVVIICFDHEQINVSELQKLVMDWNTELMPQDYVILEDHPDAPEHVNGVHMNFGKCGLLLIQKLSKLNDASDKLRAGGYYNVWSDDALAQVVTWRYKLDFGNL